MNGMKKEEEKTYIGFKVHLEVYNEALKNLIDLKKLKQHEVKDRSTTTGEVYDKYKQFEDFS